MADSKLSLKKTYENWVQFWKARVPLDEAMRLAVGGNFELIGAIELGILQHYGLRKSDYLIDVGCGSGRLAKPLSAWLEGPYLGIDLVGDLVIHARELCRRPDWRFEMIEHISIPEHDGRADMVCFFSVLTHLLHEQCYWYLEEAKRVLRPGGRIIFSFLEFREPGHWSIFENTLQDARSGGTHPLNVFVERSAIEVWAWHLDLVVDEFRSASNPVTPAGPLGQSLCVLSRPA
jgi:SAM-dependent methyltransferase